VRLLTHEWCPQTYHYSTHHSNAIIVSEGVPFLEYDLHKQLLYKLRLLGMNAIFGLRTQLCIGDNIMILYAQGKSLDVYCSNL